MKLLTVRDVFISLGTNMGDRPGNLREAVACIDEAEGVSIDRLSAVYETEPLYRKEQPYFLNMAAQLESKRAPAELLYILNRIESRLGRKRTARYAPRTIDLDIIFYGDAVLESEGLSIPHVLLHERRFVLLPLAGIAPEFICPVRNKSVKELLAECEDNSEVSLFLESLINRGALDSCATFTT